jgi:hypothetical protein
MDVLVSVFTIMVMLFCGKSLKLMTKAHSWTLWDLHSIRFSTSNPCNEDLNLDTSVSIQ